ncbi:MAG: type III-B CRISPR module RAMP protein Cmr4 [Truepera sp.]|nr:type III-B CRISPR module RAMP protein Cmr4 [Truepera sp.]
MQAKAIFWQAITPVHAGTGQDSSSVIDLPVAREAATRFPVIPASSIKGVLRDGREDEQAKKVFGSMENQGDLTLTDARLLLLPVRSYAGSFALITCPLVLQRWQRDAQALDAGVTLTGLNAPGDVQVFVTSSSQIKHGNKVILEDIDLDISGSADGLANALSQAIFGQQEMYFLERFALVSNDVFAYFCKTGMEVISRVRLESETKTVVGGALWYEEAVPAEAVFSCFALSRSNDFGEVMQKPYLQIGGKGSVGRGLLRRLGGE